MNFLSRSEMLIGEIGVKKLKNSHVAVFGLGGVGSYAVEALARAGIGELTLVDSDVISETNINRQLFALNSTIGMLKTEVAKSRVLDINPDCKVNIISEFYIAENGESFFKSKYTYIIDAIDTVSAKLDLVRRANEKSIPIISCMGTGNKIGTAPFEVADIFSTSVCPLCRVMRRELKTIGITSLTVVYSKESAICPADCAEVSEKRQIPGSISFVPPMAGLLLSGEVVRNILGL